MRDLAERVDIQTAIKIFPVPLWRTGGRHCIEIQEPIRGENYSGRHYWFEVTPGKYRYSHSHICIEVKVPTEEKT